MSKLLSVLFLLFLITLSNGLRNFLRKGESENESENESLNQSNVKSESECGWFTYSSHCRGGITICCFFTKSCKRSPTSFYCG